jgi:hypothetical protein
MHILPDADIPYLEDTDLEDVMMEPGIQDVDEFTEEAFDKLLEAEVMIPQGGTWRKGTILKRVRNKYGEPVGNRNLTHGSTPECMKLSSLMGRSKSI